MTFHELSESLQTDLLNACNGDRLTAEKLWAEILAESAAEGARKEHARCVGHLALGETSGNLELAYDAIRAGISVEEVEDKHLLSASGFLRAQLTFSRRAAKAAS